MQGQIVSVASTSNQGAIQGDDGVQYTYTPFGWRDSTVGATPGLRVDFDVRGSHAVGIYPLPGASPSYVNPVQPPAPTQPPSAPQTFPTQQFPTASPAPHQSGPQRTNGYPRNTVPVEQASRSGALIKTMVAVIVVGVIGVGAYLHFQQARSDEEIALEVAKEWSSSSIDDISELAMGLLVGNAPIVTQIGGDILADKIRDKVAWRYSEAQCPSDGQCEVSATASAALDINIPFVFNDTVTVELPFDLDIDTGTRRVTDWDPDIGAASVRGIELSDMGEGIQQAMDSSSEDVRRAVRRIQEFTEDEDVQRAVSDAANTIRNFTEDEDVQRAVSDAADTIRNFTEDEDVQRAVSDAADTIRSFTEDEDVQRAVSDAADTIRSFTEDEDVERTIRDTSDTVERGIKSFFGD